MVIKKTSRIFALTFKNKVMESHTIEISNQERFLFGGKATLTLKSLKTGSHYTYKIRSNKEKTVFFVSLLNGPNNESDYMYMGTIFDKKNFKLTTKSKLSNEAISYKAFKYYFTNLINKQLEKIEENIAAYHNGHCCACGRTLTTPESITLGIGPICAAK